LVPRSASELGVVVRVDEVVEVAVCVAALSSGVRASDLGSFDVCRLRQASFEDMLLLL
jgi:hypothetical protein